MSDYERQDNFSARDSLSTGNPEKVIMGADVDAELDAAQTAINSKANKNSGGTTGNLVSQTSTGDIQDAGGTLASKQDVDALLTAIAGLTTTEGALIYATGSDAVAVLAKGTADQVLAMNSGATAPEWVDPSGMTMVAAASVGTGGDVSQALTGTVERIEIAFSGMSTDGTGDIRIQVGTGSALTTSGYKSDATDAGSSKNSTAGFIIHARTVATNDAFSGVANLVQDRKSVV